MIALTLTFRTVLISVEKYRVIDAVIPLESPEQGQSRSPSGQNLISKKGVLNPILPGVYAPTLLDKYSIHLLLRSTEWV